MKKSTLISWIVVILLILAGWYLWTSTKTTPEVTPGPNTNLGLNGSPDQTNTGLPSVPPVATVSTSATLGNFLVASNGMTLYKYTKDTSGVSNCYNACATAWPPYTPALSNEPLLAGDGVTGTLSTITRTDGTLQLAYNGMPLYFWKNDTKPGDTTGQNVGKVWFVVKP